MDNQENYPTVIIDWDYHTFDVGEDDDTLYLYDAPSDAEFVIVEGWPYCGRYISPTIYKRADEPFKFVRAPNKSLNADPK